MDYRNWHLALGRRFRSLKIWFVLRSYGIEGFQNYIRQGIELNEYFASLVRASSTIELVTEPSFALSVFRVLLGSQTNDGPEPNALNELNRAFYARLSARPDILLTQTMINGTFCVRFAVGAARTTRRHIDEAWGIIHEEAVAAVNEWSGTRPTETRP